MYSFGTALGLMYSFGRPPGLMYSYRPPSPGGPGTRDPGTCLRDLGVLESYLNYVLFVVTVLCYSVMDVGKDLYGPLDVIDVAKGYLAFQKTENVN